MTIELNLGITFAAGLLSFLSPCVLPLIPSYFGFLGTKIAPGSQNTSSSEGGSKNLSQTVLTPQEEERKATVIQWMLVYHTFGFVMGFVMLFALLGLLFSGSAMLLYGIQSRIQILSGLLVILFAFHTWFNLFPFLQYEKKFHFLGKTNGFLGSFIAGAAFGAGWTPCIGPILASILFFAAVEGEPVLGMLYLTIYGLGLGLPFLLMSLFFQKNSTLLQYLKSHQKPVKFVSGLLLLLMGILILTGQTLVFASWLPTIGFQLERWVVENQSTGKQLGLLLLYIILGIFITLIYVSLRKGKKRKHPVLLYMLILTVLFALSLQHLDRLNMVLSIARWIQFQGI